MDHANRYAGRPVAFLLRYVSARAKSHAVIVLAVLTAVACSVGAQYGVKVLVDSLAGDSHGGAASAWLGFILLAALIGADNLLCGSQATLRAIRSSVLPAICVAICFGT